MRRRWAVLLAIGFLLCAAAGASAGVKINAWTGLTGDDRGRFEEMIKAFNAQGEVEVVPSFYSWDLLHSKLVASAQTGGAPEMLLMWVTVVPEMVRMGALQPMDALLGEAGVKGDDFVARAWNLGVVDGKRYGVPMDTHILGLYYNTELFEQAGLDPRKPPVNSMDEFVAAAKKLTKGPNQWGVAIPSSTAWPVRYWMAFLAQQGGAMFTADLKKAAFNDAKGKAAFQFMADLVHVHKVAPPVMTDINKAFLTKQAAMILIGPWLVNSAQWQEGLKFNTAPMPKIFGQFASWGMSHQLVLGKQPDRAKQMAAMKFIRYMSENSLTWVKGGQAPARKSILASAEFKAMPLRNAFTPDIQPESGWILNPPIKAQT